MACSIQEASDNVCNVRSLKHPNKTLGSLLAEGFRAVASNLSGQRAQWQRTGWFFSCKVAAGKAIFSSEKICWRSCIILGIILTCTALKAAKAGVILQGERGLPAIRVPDSVVSSVWQAAESDNVGSVDEGVDQALQGSQGNMCHRVGLDCRVGILQRPDNPLQSLSQLFCMSWVQSASARGA